MACVVSSPSVGVIFFKFLFIEVTLVKFLLIQGLFVACDISVCTRAIHVAFS